MRSRWDELEPGIADLIFRRLFPEVSSGRVPPNPAAASARLACQAWLRQTSSAVWVLQPSRRVDPGGPWHGTLGSSGWQSRFSGVRDLRIAPCDGFCSISGLNCTIWSDSPQEAAACSEPPLLKALAPLTALESLTLELYRHSLVSGVPRLLTALSSVLVSLSLRSCEIDDTHLAALASLSRLTSLNLRGNRFMQAERRGITDEGLQHLTSLTSLTDIDLSGNLEVGDNGIRFLGGLTGLASLDLHNCRQVTAAGLASLNAIAGNLTTLNLQSCRLSAQGPFPFASFTSLADLNIHFTGFLMDSDRMQALMPLRLLSSLTLDVRGDQAILSLKEFPYLRALQIIWGFSITDACCQNLAHSTGLTSLSLDTSIRLTDNGLKALAALTGLQSLSLNSSRGLTCKGVAAMCPPGLTSLNLKGCDWAASSMPPLLSSLQSLKILTLTHCSGINSDPALSRVLSAIPVGLEQLTIINVDGMAGREEITQEGLLLLNRLSSLTHLHLQFDGMTDGAMNSLSPLSNLTRLNLYRCTNLGSRALYPLVKLTKLTNLVMEASVPDTELRVLQSKFLTALTTCANLAMTYPHRRRSLDLDDYSESQFMTMNSIGNQNNIP